MALQQAVRFVSGMLGHESSIVRHGRPLYERLLTWLSGSRGIRWTINGSEFRIHPSQRHRMAPVYDAEVVRYVSERIRPGAVCIDVGANVGVYALQFAQWAGPAGRVVAFEPNPLATAVLRQHVRMNDFDRRVDVVQAAVADRPGHATFYFSDADGMSRLASPNPRLAGQTRPTEVQVITLDGYCDAHRIVPDWLLIDVEGFEFAVLSGARHTISRSGGDLNLIVEMHPNAWAAAGWSRSAGEDLVRELGLTAVSLTGECDPFAVYGHVLLSRSAAT
jgi:FkbM family methyltransferase